MSLSSYTKYAKTEFGGCNLSHMSRTNLLVKIAAGLARNSDQAFLFVAPRRATTDLLVRANQARLVESVGEECKLMSDVLKKAPVLGGYELQIPRNNGRKAHKAQPTYDKIEYL